MTLLASFKTPVKKHKTKTLKQHKNIFKVLCHFNIFFLLEQQEEARMTKGNVEDASAEEEQECWFGKDGCRELSQKESGSWRDCCQDGVNPAIPVYGDKTRSTLDGDDLLASSESIKGQNVVGGQMNDTNIQLLWLFILIIQSQRIP